MIDFFTNKNPFNRVRREYNSNFTFEFSFLCNHFLYLISSIDKNNIQTFSSNLTLRWCIITLDTVFWRREKAIFIPYVSYKIWENRRFSFHIYILSHFAIFSDSFYPLVTCHWVDFLWTESTVSPQSSTVIYFRSSKCSAKEKDE